MAKAKYRITCPGYKTSYFQSFDGAYDRLVGMIHADEEICEATVDYGYNDGLVLWERRTEAGHDVWRYDSANTNEAWSEVSTVAKVT